MSNTRELNDLLGELKAAAPSGYAIGLHIRFAAPLITAHTYPEEWLRIYTSRAYALRDPLIFWGLSCEGTTRWSEIELPDPFDIFGQAREFGLNFGCAVACGPLTSRTIVGAARADREFEDAEIAGIQAIVWKMHEIAEPPEELTKAQVEALKCIADGDRHIAAAARLGISESALKARLTAAREKLSARTTSEAIQRAKDYRLI
jgi:LuxR family transcriptional regulator, quorum-sensing system regulator SdiA